VPAGLRISLAPTGLAVRVRLALSEPLPMYDWAQQAVAVWQGPDLRETHRVLAGDVELTVQLPSDGPPVDIHLPAHMDPEVLDVGSLSSGEVSPEPAPRGPAWLAYGDSITAGWSAPLPGSEWVARLARDAGLDVVNLGLPAAADGHAEQISEIVELPATLVTVAIGTNCWSRLPHSAEEMGDVMTSLVARVRADLPDASLVVISPLLRPEAEAVPNSAGATLAQLRESIEAAVRPHADRDSRVRLVEGRPLLGADELVDGLHPGSEGHKHLAETLADVVATLSPLARPGADGSSG
jgi:lysophospholipase L1-like esterase